MPLQMLALDTGTIRGTFVLIQIRYYLANPSAPRIVLVLSVPVLVNHDLCRSEGRVYKPQVLIFLGEINPCGPADSCDQI
jgi:hypothetical protein